MNSRKKFLEKLLLVALLAAVLSTAYTHFGILPGKARDYAIQKIEALSGKKVRFDKALYFPFHGFIFYNLHVAEKNGAPLFSARRYGLDIKIIPFFREKKIVITNIYLDRPVYDLLLEPRKKTEAKKEIKTEISGQISVPVASDEKKVTLENLSGGPDFFLPENVYIEQIQIVDGYMTIRSAAGTPVLETLQEINVRAAFQKPPVLQLDGALKIGQKPYAQVSLSGFWDLKTASYRFNLSANWERIPSWLQDYQKNHFLVLEKAGAKWVAEIKSVGEEKALFHARAGLEEARLRVHGTNYDGSMRLDAKGLFNFDTKVVERYKGSLELVDVAILNLSPKIARIDHVAGNIDFIPDLLTIQTLRGKYKDIPFDARGTLKSFKELLLDGEISTSTDLEKIFSLIPAEQKKILKDFDISGNCQALTLIRGSLKNTAELSTEYKMALRGGALLSRDEKVALSGLSCDLFSGKEGLRVSGARFIFDKKNYTASLFIPKDPASAGTLNLASRDLSLQTAYYLREDRIQIENARAQLPGITAQFSGFFHRTQKSFLEIGGKAVLDLAQILKTYSSENSRLNDLGLIGSLSGAFTFKGAWSEWTRSQISFNGKSGALKFKKNFRLEDLNLGAQINNGILDILHLSASAYGGRVGIKGWLDLNVPQIPFDTNFYASGLDLHRLAAELPLENKKLAGNLMLQSSLRGRLLDPGSFTGHGALSVKNGHLWETSQFKAMGNLPLVRVEGLDLVVFREMSAAYEIRGKKLWTDSLAMASDTVHLGLRGSLGFDQSLDMLMDIEYTNAVFLGAQDAGGIVPMMVNQAANMISQYKISGTLKKPRYDKAGVPGVDSIGKKIGGLLNSLTS